MKRSTILPLAAAIAVAVAACNNDNNATTENNTDTATGSTADMNSGTTTQTSSGSYAAQADSFRLNSEAGNYLDPQTGKSIRINVDSQTGRRTNAETGDPVWRYVDRRTWWVYGNDSWDTVGSARMEGNQLRYRTNEGQWETYEKRWKAEDDKLLSDWKTKMDDDGDIKMKNDKEDAKIKMDKDGDVKIKTKDGKTKIDADDGEVKHKH